MTGIPYPVYIDAKWRGLVSEAVFPAVFFVFFLCSRRVREEREMVMFSVPQYHTLNVLYISYPISWILATVANGALLYVACRRLNKSAKLT